MMAPRYKPKKIVAATKVAIDIPNNKPIIFWDTCMLLYIISIPVRESFTELELYNTLLTWIEEGRITSVTSSVVWDEFTQHYSEIKTEAEENQNELKVLLNGYAGCFADPIKNNINSIVESLDLVTILEDIEKRIWRQTYVIRENAHLRNIAHFRVLHKISPSKKKDQYKDSIIWATFLHVASMLPKELFEIYVTSNREDFCISKKSTNLQDEINDDCNRVNAEFCVELNTLVNLMTRELGRI